MHMVGGARVLARRWSLLGHHVRLVLVVSCPSLCLWGNLLQVRYSLNMCVRSSGFGLLTLNNALMSHGSPTNPKRFHTG
ncbi:hypothetical protein B0J12DRAFT_666339 [Macrophomina phaseolina]|uniref:Secreted protein n=1 Tax=Macrophomina phaseolina TaxID=35725 RepID=A0ABQ8G7D0_9PEZI|nr:hypothetical protein B0J12DRAFT_666339 [Macrophomina phaseolina]